MTSTSLRRFVYHSFEFIYNSIYFYSPTITILLFLVIFSKRIATFFMSFHDSCRPFHAIFFCLFRQRSSLHVCVAESFLGMRNAPRGNNITPNVENIIQSICMPPAPKRFLRSGKRCVIWVLLFVPSVEKFYFGEEEKLHRFVLVSPVCSRPRESMRNARLYEIVLPFSKLSENDSEISKF